MSHFGPFAFHRLGLVRVRMPLSPWGRVALLGIAQRSISIKYAHISRNRKQAKALSVNIKTIAGWIKVKRTEKNLTPGHLAAKMGIATVLVRSWESGASQPDSKQLQDLAKTFGVDEASIPNWEKNTYQPGGTAHAGHRRMARL